MSAPRPRKSNPAPARVAGVLERAGVLAIVILERAADSLRLIAAAESPDAQHARAFLDQHAPLHVVRVVPAGRTIARPARIPSAISPDEAASALALLAEGEFSARLPQHRRAAGLLPPVADAHDRRALLTAWPDTGEPIQPLSSHQESWASEIAALARLRGPSRAPAWSLDPRQGSIAILAERNGHLACRSLRADAPSTDAPANPPRTNLHAEQHQWMLAAREVLLETCASVGVEPLPPGQTLHHFQIEDAASRELARRIDAIPADRAWLDRFAIPLGAALLELDPDPLVRSLARLSPLPPRTSLPPLARLGSYLSAPRRAAIVIAASLLAAIAAPIALAWARLAILDARVQTLDQAQADRDRLETLAAMYTQLDRERLPLTKLLADLAASAPVEPPDMVLLSLVRITAEREIAIDGAAGSPALVATFQQRLNESGLFQNVTLTRSAATGDAVEFSLSARINPNPHRVLARSQDTDFLAQSTPVRLFGQEAAARLGSSPVARATSDTSPRQRPASRPSPGRDDEQPQTRERPAQVDIPEPLTDDALNALSRTDAMMAFARRRNVVQSNPDLDEATRNRLNEEADRLRARLDALRAGGGS